VTAGLPSGACENIRTTSDVGISSHATPAGEPLTRVRLVPVEMFGAGEEDCPECPATVTFGCGLMDAVSGYSDCNRAIGHIYRVDEEDSEPYRAPGDTITVYVPESELPKFARRYGDIFDGRCPACHVRYDELPEGHQVRRPTCAVVTRM
jgi:hypothetical protein